MHVIFLESSKRITASQRFPIHPSSYQFCPFLLCLLRPSEADPLFCLAEHVFALFAWPGSHSRCSVAGGGEVMFVAMRRGEWLLMLQKQPCQWRIERKTSPPIHQSTCLSHSKAKQNNNNRAALKVNMKPDNRFNNWKG